MKIYSIGIVITATAFMSLGSLEARAGSLEVYVEAPGIQTSQATGPGVTISTEGFDGIPTGLNMSLATAVGQVTAPGDFWITQANQWGGAGGTGNYFTFGGFTYSGPVSLALNGPQAYFGLWWSAADANNNLALYDPAGKLLGSFDTQYVLQALSRLPVGSQYFGNPNNGQDWWEPFFYISFVATGGESISQVVLSNSYSTESFFESDNWSVSAVAPTGGLGTLISVPEPSSWVLALPLCFLVLYSRRATWLAGSFISR